MSPGALLLRLGSRGISVHVEDGKLRVRGELTDADRDEIRAYRDELVSRFSWPAAHREIWAHPVRWFADFPHPATVSARAKGIAVPVLFTTSRVRADREREGVVFSPREYERACHAAELERAYASDFRVWCERKLANRNWRLTPHAAHSGVALADRPTPPDTDALFEGGAGLPHRLRWGWSWGAFFTRLELELVGVDVEQRDAVEMEQAHVE